MLISKHHQTIQRLYPLWIRPFFFPNWCKNLSEGCKKYRVPWNLDTRQDFRCSLEIPFVELDCLSETEKGRYDPGPPRSRSYPPLPSIMNIGASSPPRPDSLPFIFHSRPIPISTGRTSRKYLRIPKIIIQDSHRDSFFMECKTGRARLRCHTLPEMYAMKSQKIFHAYHFKVSMPPVDM